MFYYWPININLLSLNKTFISWVCKISSLRSFAFFYMRVNIILKAEGNVMRFYVMMPFETRHKEKVSFPSQLFLVLWLPLLVLSRLILSFLVLVSAFRVLLARCVLTKQMSFVSVLLANIITYYSSLFIII